MVNFLVTYHVYLSSLDYGKDFDHSNVRRLFVSGLHQDIAQSVEEGIPKRLAKIFMNQILFNLLNFITYAPRLATFSKTWPFTISHLLPFILQ